MGSVCALVTGGCESCVKTADALFDVVTDEAHALDAVDAAFGGFVGVPVLEAGSGKGVDVGFAPQCDDDVDVAGQLQVNGFGVWSVMSIDLSQNLGGEIVDGGAGLGAGGIHRHGVTGDLAHQSGGPLRLAGVLDADEQH